MAANPPDVLHIVELDGSTVIGGVAPWAAGIDPRYIAWHHAAAEALFSEQDFGDCYWLAVALWAASTLAAAYPGVASTGESADPFRVASSEKIGQVAYTFTVPPGSGQTDGLTGIAGQYRAEFHTLRINAGAGVSMLYVV